MGRTLSSEIMLTSMDRKPTRRLIIYIPITRTPPEPMPGSQREVDHWIPNIISLVRKVRCDYAHRNIISGPNMYIYMYTALNTSKGYKTTNMIYQRVCVLINFLFLKREDTKMNSANHHSLPMLIETPTSAPCMISTYSMCSGIIQCSLK